MVIYRIIWWVLSRMRRIFAFPAGKVAVPPQLPERAPDDCRNDTPAPSPTIGDIARDEDAVPGAGARTVNAAETQNDPPAETGTNPGDPSSAPVARPTPQGLSSEELPGTASEPIVEPPAMPPEPGSRAPAPTKSGLPEPLSPPSGPISSAAPGPVGHAQKSPEPSPVNTSILPPPDDQTQPPGSTLPGNAAPAIGTVHLRFDVKR